MNEKRHKDNISIIPYALAEEERNESNHFLCVFDRRVIPCRYSQKINFSMWTKFHQSGLYGGRRVESKKLVDIRTQRHKKHAKACII